MLLVLLDTNGSEAPATGVIDCRGLGGEVQPVTLRNRTSSINRTTGRWVRGEAQNRTICADVQPAPGTTTQTRTDGGRSPDTAVAYVRPDVEVRSVDQHGQQEASHIFVPRWSAWYQVQGVADHYGSGTWMAHRKLTLTRVQEGQEP